jgi:hypothetical protein
MDRKWTEFGQGVGRGKPTVFNINIRVLESLAKFLKVEKYTH